MAANVCEKASAELADDTTTQVEKESKSQLSSNISAVQKQIHFNFSDIFCVFISLATFICDQVTDFMVAVYFYHHEMFLYFSLTLAFVLLPSLIMNIISFSWSIHDYRNGTKPGTKCLWIVRVISVFMNSNMIIRYFELLCSGCSLLRRKPKGKESYYVICDETDACLIRLFGCFMETAPQLIIQMYILIMNDIEETDELPLNTNLQVLSIISSLVSFSWTIASYNRSLHLTQADKLKLSGGVTCCFMWRFCEIVSRILPLSLFATIYPFYLFVIVTVHWVIMSIWIMLQKTEFCKTRKQEMMFDLLLGVIYIFCFMNVNNKPTIYKAAAFYLVGLMEGAALIMTWFLISETLEWYQVPALVTFFSLFVFSLVLMRIYYLFFHPKVNLAKKTNAAVESGCNMNNLTIYPNPKKLSRRSRTDFINVEETIKL